MRARDDFWKLDSLNRITHRQRLHYGWVIRAEIDENISHTGLWRDTFD